MRIVSWNVNGIRSIYNKGFLKWMRADRPDVLGLQEIKATAEQVPAPLQRVRGWQPYYCPAQRPGYSGTAVYTRVAPGDYSAALGVPEFDAEGRLQQLDYG